MDPRDELFINRYHYSDDKYIETVRERHYWESDVWLCEYESRKKRFITTVNTQKDTEWMENVKSIINSQKAMAV